MKNVEAEAWKPRILMRVVTNNQTVFQRRVTHDSHIKARAPLFPWFSGHRLSGQGAWPKQETHVATRPGNWLTVKYLLCSNWYYDPRAHTLNHTHETAATPGLSVSCTAHPASPVPCVPGANGGLSSGPEWRRWKKYSLNVTCFKTALKQIMAGNPFWFEALRDGSKMGRNAAG